VSPLAAVAATAVGAAAGWLVGPTVDAIAVARYGPDSPGYDPEDLELALLPAPTTRRTRVVATIVTAVAAGLLAMEFDGVDVWFYFAALSWAYVVAAVIDLQYLRLPDLLTAPAALVAVAGSFVIAAREGVTEAAFPGPFVAVGLAAFLYAVSLVFRVVRGQDAFGLGDVKLELSLAASVAWLGWTHDLPVAGPVQLAILAAFAGFLIGALAGLPAAGFRISRHIPFGPFLMIGWFVVVLLADTVRG
jgi:leader peptidase (prepilin peptidase)/N-methyltransferase